MEERTRPNRTNAEPDVVYQTPPSPDKSVSHLAEEEKPRMANKALAGVSENNLLPAFRGNEVLKMKGKIKRHRGFFISWKTLRHH